MFGRYYAAEGFVVTGVIILLGAGVGVGLQIHHRCLLKDEVLPACGFTVVIFDWENSILI